MRLRYVTIALALVASASPAVPAQDGPAAGPAGATTAPAGDAFDERAAGIVGPMRFSDADKTEAVTRLTANYLRSLAAILDDRRAALERIGQGTGPAPEIDAQSAAAWMVSRKAAVALRDAYVAGLGPLMTPYQVERIKDGITRDALPETLQVYDEMVPDLTHPQRAHVLGLLTEMRENAMLELDAAPQEQWVHKYRGIINNYVAKQGHDFAALSKAYDAKRGKD